MRGIDWLALLSIIISVGTPVAIFLARNWLKAHIEKGVQHHFDVQIESSEPTCGKAKSFLRATCARRKVK